jgi:hypothetical protein
MFAHHHDRNPGNTELTKRIAESLGIGEVSMNEVDFDDLFVSEGILKTLYRAARDTSGPEAQDGVPLVSAYWIADSRDLVLCAASMVGLHLIRVPEKSWTLKPRTVH